MDPSLSLDPHRAVGVIGAGRVGAVLGAALLAAGHPVLGVTARRATSRERAAALLPGVPLREPAEVARAAELLLLAVPDDVLADLVDDLALAGAFRNGQLVVHTSGRYGVAVLEPAARRGAGTLALHPALPFTGTAADLARLPNARFGLTTGPALRPLGEALVRRLGAEPVWVAEHLRPLWHAALAHGANHLVTLVASAADLLRLAGVADPAPVLRPLLTAALADALLRGDDALTGPVVRGDAGTVAAHLSVLPDDVRPAYLALARLTTTRAVAAGRLPAGPAERVLEVL